MQRSEGTANTTKELWESMLLAKGTTTAIGYMQHSHNKELVITGSMYPNKEIHKITWISPDGRS